MMKYRIYIDEVGNPDLESSDNPNHRFLSLTGVILELGHVERDVHPQMERLKAKYFRSHPDDPVIFHRKEMVNYRPPFEALKDDEVRERFDEELLALLAQWQYTVITVCLDKKKHKDTYNTWRYDPYHYCLAVLLERFAFFLGREGAKGDVMAESRGGKEDLRLKKSFERLWELGTQYVEQAQFQERFTSKQLKVKTKTNNIAGLQICDLLAHSSRHEILWENNLIDRPPAPFAEKVIHILQQKYDRRGGKFGARKCYKRMKKALSGLDGLRHPPPENWITRIMPCLGKMSREIEWNGSSFKQNYHPRKKITDEYRVSLSGSPTTTRHGAEFCPPVIFNNTIRHWGKQGRRKTVSLPDKNGRYRQLER